MDFYVLQVIGDENESDEDDSNLLLLYCLMSNQKLMTVFRKRVDNFTDIEFRNYFRFEKAHFWRLHDLFELPDLFKLRNRAYVTGEEILMILLRRLAYPVRWVDLRMFFGVSNSTLSLAFKYSIEKLYLNFNHLLVFDSARIVPLLSCFANAVARKGSPLLKCVGFIDGTARFICRPTFNQQEYFSGHKRAHCLKFQGVVTPDGIIVHLSGPWNGRRHDAGMLAESGIDISIGRPLLHENVQYVLYGDPAYPLTSYLIAPYRERNLTAEQNLFNQRMSNVRESVEWAFGKVSTLFAFVDFKKNLKLHLQPVAKYYSVAVFLTNCHTCFYGSQISSFFNLEPPTIEEYLNKN